MAKRKIDTVRLGSELVLRCPMCKRLGSVNDQDERCNKIPEYLVAITNITAYCGSTVRVRCAPCGWNATVMIAENGMARQV